MKEPIGDLCVLREEGGSGWIVCLCRGVGRRDHLQRFETRQEAAAFAASQQELLKAQLGLAVDVHFPEDCPCPCPEPAKDAGGKSS